MMTPDIILRKILAKACLDRLPWLEIRENELSLWLFWEKRRAPSERANLRRKEKRSGKPLGPRGNWARRKHEYGSWYRPHRVDEVVVEWMSSAFYPDYITVLSSGPYGGGVFLIYRNDSFLSEEKDLSFPPPEGFPCLDEMRQWINRFLEPSGNNS